MYFSFVVVLSSHHDARACGVVDGRQLLPMINCGPTAVEAYSLSSGGRMPEPVLLDAAMSAATVLFVAHVQRLAVVDLKPAHFLRRASGVIPNGTAREMRDWFVLCDFGSVRPIGDALPAMVDKSGTTAMYFDAISATPQMSLVQRDVRTLAVSLFHMASGKLATSWKDCKSVHQHKVSSPSARVVMTAVSATNTWELLDNLVVLTRRGDLFASHWQYLRDFLQALVLQLKITRINNIAALIAEFVFPMETKAPAK